MDVSKGEEYNDIRFEIRGLGHHIPIVAPADSPVSVLKDQIGSQIGLSPPYQRLIVRGTYIQIYNTPSHHDDATSLNHLSLLPYVVNCCIFYLSPRVVSYIQKYTR